MKISYATVIKGNGADKVFLHTNLPDACFPYTPNALTLDFNCARDNAEKYLAEHFPDLPIMVVQKVK